MSNISYLFLGFQLTVDMGCMESPVTVQAESSMTFARLKRELSNVTGIPAKHTLKGNGQS